MTAVLAAVVVVMVVVVVVVVEVVLVVDGVSERVMVVVGNSVI